jgi:hypothetical protein
MARLTGFSRLLLTLVIVAGVFFGVRYLFPNLGKSGADAPTPRNNLHKPPLNLRQKRVPAPGANQGHPLHQRLLTTPHQRLPMAN